MVQPFLLDIRQNIKKKIFARIEQGIKYENLRLTIAWLPVNLNLDSDSPGKLASDPKDLSKQLVNRAQLHRIEQGLYGKELQYCLGLNPETGGFALPHITAAQVKIPDEMSMDKFMTFVVEVAPSISNELVTNISARGVFDVPARNGSYTPVMNYRTGWYDDNIDKGPLTSDLASIGRVLNANQLLGSVVNALGANGENSRPHFTNWREDINQFLATPEVESIRGEDGKKFGLIPVIAISDESGMLFLHNLLTVCVDGKWLEPENAKHLVLSPEEAPMPSLAQVVARGATKAICNSYRTFLAGATLGCATMMLAQQALGSNYSTQVCKP